MLLLNVVVGVVVIVVVGLSGLILNSIILAVNFSDWIKSKHLQSCDQIYTAIGLVNLLLQCGLASQNIIFLVCAPILFSKDVFNTFLNLLMFLFYYKVWLNAFLCVYYVTSIASFRYSLFEWLKRNFSAILPKLMLVAGVGSLPLSILYNWNADAHLESVSYGNATINSTSSKKSIAAITWYHLLASTLGCLCPFIISVLCLGHTLISLSRHVWRVKHNDVGFSDRILQAHIRAARTMVFLLILYLTYFTMQVIGLVCEHSHSTTTLLIFFVILLLPVTHSLIVIQASSRLRKVFQRRRHIRG